MAVIETRHLSLVRGGNEVLRDVSLAIEPGEIFILIGPSGSGKSSLLRCLNRLEEPAPGTVFLRGEDITAMPVITLRRRVGMVFQLPAMFPGTVADNIAYGPALRGEALSDARIAELLDMVMLSPALADRPATELSGGQVQRVAVARALANESGSAAAGRANVCPGPDCDARRRANAAGTARAPGSDAGLGVARGRAGAAGGRPGAVARPGPGGED
ncbi:MAG: ATP-binding cassette domain-containing protein [Acidimicrobiia bacterium]|nr:ATP-binding cassette domain-containing protein [Acidimicrobiia bacterium]